MKVLLIEDEFLLAMHVEEVLSDLGFEVVETAATLQHGLSLAMTGRFDVALLDINLNGTDSYPIADALIQRSIPFIFVSGYTGKGIDSRYRDVVAVQKPYTSKTLESALSRAIKATTTRPAR